MPESRQPILAVIVAVGSLVVKFCPRIEALEASRVKTPIWYLSRVLVLLLASGRAQLRDEAPLV